ncbi:MAG TPA: GAF domain-containing protein [Candidatus Cloacimonetes bacterium]|nr:GAF domain-containing protein [Candidatus Cloacimonadota bacterium]
MKKTGISKPQEIEQLIKKNRSLVEIGKALSAEKNLDAVLEMVVDKAREFTNADAGSIYILTPDEKTLQFKIIHTDSLNWRMGGTSGNPITLPDIPIIREDGHPNLMNVCSYVAYTGKAVNIPDVYFAENFNFANTKIIDAANNYRSKSMLVLPMRNHENDIIGVLSLINAMEKGKIVPFSKDVEEITEALASQAAIALTNSILIHDLEELLESFIRSIAHGMGIKSPHTGNHIRRVEELTMQIARTINSENSGKFSNTYFNEDEMKELRIAAWMHDIGKITTPEFIFNKATKLQTIFDRIKLLETRFNLIKEIKKNEHSGQKYDLIKRGKKEEVPALEKNFEKQINELEDEINFLNEVNIGKEYLAEEKIDRIKSISRKKYILDGQEFPYLEKNEVENLIINKGTLTQKEKQMMDNHANVSYEMLHELPFPKKMNKIPIYASGHHEKLDGSGYPLGLKAEQLPLQTRILAIADIFDALTAHDRPYKEGKTLSESMSILEKMVLSNFLDKDIFEIFRTNKLYLLFAEKELKKEQIDME